MNPTPFKDLAGYAHKQLIPCVEGTLVSINDPLEYKAGPNAGHKYQYATLKDAAGLTHDVKFDTDNTVQDKANKGKLIRIEAHQGGKGLSGVYYDINEYPAGKINHRIRTTATAVISYPQAGNAPQSAPAASAPPSAPQQPTPRQDAPQRAPAANAAHSGGQPPQAVFDDALADYKRAFCKVCEAFGHTDPQIEMQALTAEKLAEITTCVSMASTRGQYGAYIGYHFAEDGHAAPQASPQEPAKAALPTWKDFVNAKAKGGPKKLGDYDAATFQKLAAWAYDPKTTANNNETKVLIANVRMGVVERQIARNVFFQLLAEHPGYGTEFDEQDLETVCGEQYGKASANMTANEWGECLDKFSAIVEDCRTAHNSDPNEPPF